MRGFKRTNRRRRARERAARRESLRELLEPGYIYRFLGVHVMSASDFLDGHLRAPTDEPSEAGRGAKRRGRGA